MAYINSKLCRTTSYGSSLSFLPNNDLFNGGSKTSHSKHAQLSTPVGLTAEVVSATGIRVSWTDTNDGFNQYYTIRYNSRFFFYFNQDNTFLTKIMKFLNKYCLGSMQFILCQNFESLLRIKFFYKFENT